MTNKFSFTFASKETYLAWCAEWYQRFLANLKSVREAKAAIRQANRDYGKGEAKLVEWKPYLALRDAHKETKELLLERAASRVEAGRQMMAKAST